MHSDTATEFFKFACPVDDAFLSLGECNRSPRMWARIFMHDVTVARVRECRSRTVEWLQACAGHVPVGWHRCQRYGGWCVPRDEMKMHLFLGDYRLGFCGIMMHVHANVCNWLLNPLVTKLKNRWFPEVSLKQDGEAKLSESEGLHWDVAVSEWFVSQCPFKEGQLHCNGVFDFARPHYRHMPVSYIVHIGTFEILLLVPRLSLSGFREW